MRIDSTLARQNLYARLGVRPGATTQEIRAAYRRLVRAWHPDRSPVAAASADRMAQINLAATVLLDPGLRALYDERRCAARSAADEAEHSAPRRPDPWDCFRSVGGGSTEWQRPAGTTPLQLDDEARALVAACRPRWIELASELQAWAASRSAPWTAGFTALCLLASVALVSWARPTSLYSRDPTASARTAEPDER